MPRDSQELLFVGIKDVVIALRPDDGAEVWRAKLKGGDFVTILWDGEGRCVPAESVVIYGHSLGTAPAIELATRVQGFGEILWRVHALRERAAPPLALTKAQLRPLILDLVDFAPSKLH